MFLIMATTVHSRLGSFCCSLGTHTGASKYFLSHSVVARNNDILKQLVLEAKREYEKDAEHRVHIFMGDT
jgi:hypothetical protein